MSLLYTYRPPQMISSVYSFSLLSILLLFIRQELSASGSTLVQNWAFLNLYSHLLDIFQLKILVKVGKSWYSRLSLPSVILSPINAHAGSSISHSVSLESSLILPWEKYSWDLETRGRETSYFFLPLISRSTVLYFLLINITTICYAQNNGRFNFKRKTVFPFIP